MKVWKIIFGLLYFSSVSLTNETMAFEGFEHWWIGETTLLKFPEDHEQEGRLENAYDPNKLQFITEHYQLETPNSQYLVLGEKEPYKISFGDMIAISGDYFALTYDTISNAVNQSNLLIDGEGHPTHETRFRLAFSTFIPQTDAKDFDYSSLKDYLEDFNPYREPSSELKNNQRYTFWHHKTKHLSGLPSNPFNPQVSVPKLRNFFYKSLDVTYNYEVQDPNQRPSATPRLPGVLGRKGLARLEDSSSSLQERLSDLHTTLVRSTTLRKLVDEFFLSPISYKPRDILLLNFDHFGQQAIEVYKTGHSLALHLAGQAYGEKSMSRKIRLLNYAYAMDGFALHFLTDLFSSGHIRTPRLELYENAFTQVTGGIAATSMHDEDSYYGLNVSNSRDLAAGRPCWKAYGDKAYFSPRNHANRFRIRQATQASVDEVWDAFNNVAHRPKEYDALDYIPTPCEKNSSPLFKIVYSNGGKAHVLMREDKFNIQANAYDDFSATAHLQSFWITQDQKFNPYDFRSVINQINHESPPTSSLFNISAHCKRKTMHKSHLSALTALFISTEKYPVLPIRYTKNEKILVVPASEFNHFLDNCADLKYGSSEPVTIYFGVPEIPGLLEITKIFTYDDEFDGGLHVNNDFRLIDERFKDESSRLQFYILPEM